jgi:hypothetical protein
MIRLIELNEDGTYQNDFIVETDELNEFTELPACWTADIPPDGMYIPTYVGGLVGERGEQTAGAWEDHGAPPPLTSEQILQMATDRLNALTRQANAQVSALAGRVTTLDFLINGQDEEDPDYIPPTDADVAELAQRKTQLKQWNTYNVKLGKVKSAAAWPTATAWPAMPEIYTNETAVLSASAS